MLCGSVSSWIEENILNDTSFLGRISSVLHLKELALKDCSLFWQDEKSLIQHSPYEKLKFLSITGGIPRYLEELKPQLTVEENIDKLCFKTSGFLYDEMTKIFNDSFENYRVIYKDIIDQLQKHHLTFSEIGKQSGISLGGSLTEYLKHLEMSGFITQDYLWNLEKNKLIKSRYRLSDNYLRFYLRCIQPNHLKIQQGLFKSFVSDSLTNWRSIIGLQFENLVFNNLFEIISTDTAYFSSYPLYSKKNI